MPKAPRGPARHLAGNLDGARYSEAGFAAIFPRRLSDPFGHEVHPMAYIADNSAVDAVLADILG